MSFDLNTLNEEQRSAVTTTEGPLLILAGAGSGKTRVLTFRIAYLLDQKLAAPEQILAVTFTNKAAAEMKERIAELIGGGTARLPWMGTFHSIAVKMLRIDGHLIGMGSNFTIYDPTDQQGAIKEAMDNLKISKKDVNPRAVHNYISSAKNEMVLPEDYAGYAKGYFQELVAKIYPEYQRILKENNAVDFDDLLLNVVMLLKENPQTLEKYQNMFRYILVDEYQDTNHVQYVMVNMLAEKHRNLAVVGDDDQSIYAFRGATIRNILNFERDYQDAKVVKLEQNYRSTKRILEAAFEVVSKNRKRTDKKLWTDNADGKKITIYTAENEKDEADWVVKNISGLTSEGVDPEEIAVLYRTNAQSRALEEGFIKHAVSYRIVGGVRFYERREIKDILAFLRAIYNPLDDVSVLRVINVPRRGIGAKTITNLQEAAKAKGLKIAQFLLDDADSLGSKGVVEFAEILKRIYNAGQDLNIVDLINYVLDQTKYIDMLSDGTSENEARIENIKELISVASKYGDLEAQSSLSAFLEDVSLVEAETEAASEEGTAKVTMMTIHAAKGLEFKYVFVVGVEEGLFPHSRVFTDPDELEEERRLAYVAITRAKEELFLVHADSRLYFGSRQQNVISRFIEDIPENLVERKAYSGITEWVTDDEDEWESEIEVVDIKIGDRVRHEHFGVGTVLSLDDSTVKINFGPVYKVKELAREFAPLQRA